MAQSQLNASRVSARPAAGSMRPCCRRAARSAAMVVKASLSSKEASASPAMDRRSLLLGGGAMLAAVDAFSVMPARAETESAASAAAIYEDPIDKFTLAVPAGWASGSGAIDGASGYSGATGARRTIAFFPDDPSVHDVNILVVVTNVSVEFTKLGSFGNIDAFASNLVNSLDRSFLLRAKKPPTEPIQIAKLVDYKATSRTYDVEYTVQQLPGPQRHLLSSVMLGSNGTYNRLYTVTAQCFEEDLPKYRSVLQTAIKSFNAELRPAFA